MTATRWTRRHDEPTSCIMESPQYLALVGARTPVNSSTPILPVEGLEDKSDTVTSSARQTQEGYTSLLIVPRDRETLGSCDLDSPGRVSHDVVTPRSHDQFPSSSHEQNYLDVRTVRENAVTTCDNISSHNKHLSRKGINHKDPDNKYVNDPRPSDQVTAGLTGKVNHSDKQNIRTVPDIHVHSDTGGRTCMRHDNSVRQSLTQDATIYESVDEDMTPYITPRKLSQKPADVTYASLEYRPAPDFIKPASRGSPPHHVLLAVIGTLVVVIVILLTILIWQLNTSAPQIMGDKANHRHYWLVVRGDKQGCNSSDVLLAGEPQGGVPQAGVPQGNISQVFHVEADCVSSCLHDTACTGINIYHRDHLKMSCDLIYQQLTPGQLP